VVAATAEKVSDIGLTTLLRVCQGDQASAEGPPAEEVPVVSIWTYVTAPTPIGARGDVCPETATMGVRSRHLRKIVTTMSVGVAAFVGGGQDGPEAFAAERREGPT
jgi:hypothetical protein